MLPDQLVEMKWGTSNQPHYKNLGYNYTKVGDVFLVKATELTKSSLTKVRVICDGCGIEYLQKYYNYRLNEKDLCRECIAKQQRVSYEKIKQVFEEKNLTILIQESEYKRNKQKIPFRCNLHPEEIQTTKYNTISVRGMYPCKYCYRESTLGAGNPNYNTGNRSTITYYLRNQLSDWKLDILALHNYTCFVTGKEKDNTLQIHHLTPFRKLMEQAHLENNIEYKINVENYTLVELELLRNSILKLHTIHDGVPVCKEKHIEFHSKFGKTKCTFSDFWDFRAEYIRTSKRPLTHYEWKMFDE